MKKWTWTCLVGLGLAVGACGSDAGQGTTDGDTELDIEIFVPDLVPVDLVEETAAPDVAEVVEPPKPGEFGYACDEALDCNSGWCVQTADGRQCTQTCIEACPSGYECREAPGVDAVFICAPKFLNLCDPCREAADCNAPGTAGNYCLAYGAKGRFCGAGCNTDPDCPGGYVCRNVPVGGGQEAKQCVPVDGAECTCSPFAKQLQKATVCFDENDNGKCEGTRFCLQSGLSLCDAATPFPESCNSLDDNCNSVTDEFPPGYVCQITNDIGTCPGVGTCIEGVESCEGNAPKLDNNCDGIDDDCDGSTDEEACNDGNACTNDLCATGAGGELICTHTNNNTSLCDDGSVCTQVDKCQDGACVGFNPLVCGDGNPCFTSTCDSVVGCLTSFANGASCEDGEPCTKSDACNQGLCVAGNWDTCDDGNACTVDSCVRGQGCTHLPAQNGISCGGAAQPGGCTQGTCSNGLCVGTPIREGLECTFGGGVPACKQPKCLNGTCSLTNQPPGTVCGSEDICPPCVDAIGSIFGCCFGLFEEEVAKRCDSQGSCTVRDQSQTTCGSSSCGGACAGTCVPACGIGVCFQ